MLAKRAAADRAHAPSFDPKTHGIFDDDYETFLTKRAETIAAKLTEKLRPVL
jgi:hypothetical protein